MEMLVPRKSSKKKSRLDYIRYDSLRHQLDVGMCEQRFTYMGVPDSLYVRLLRAETPDEIFMQDIFNKYPVVVSADPKLPRVKRKKKRI